ncbi:zf-HC2 domain-containing protein [Streptomyces sp. BPTC-684]|uniref:zf-HC2 domain-containing protein n=1 Tax=Streptomyces sp. BPTC-684 TaxID=3043734 RepID=UPI0024B217B7|nr:zf-HC2 domain-containing protein [Streptomyces sp. BPTC-684]WHM36770.1 zf-HC2 domain-containing protein [Streptomyces sp. BPTC-684]
MTGTSPTPAEQHLGDRLAALVDGELSHDARERVLSHLATCPKCKAEADAQRRVKSVFAQTAPPAPSEGLLARLQGLPGGPGGDDDGRGPLGGSRLADGVFSPGVLSDPRDPGGRFGYAPGGAHAAVLGGGLPGRGFRIHEVGRPEERSGSPWRGRRIAFAAASAVSFAAIALGGAVPSDSGADTSARGDGSGSNVTPLRAQSPSAGPASGTSLSVESERRRGGAASAPLAPEPTAPVPMGLAGLNGIPSQPSPQQFGNPFRAALLSSSSLPPLIRPAVATLAMRPVPPPSALPGATPSVPPTQLAAPRH